MAVPPADLGESDSKLPVLQIDAEIDPQSSGDGSQHIPETMGQRSASEMHEVKALFAANRFAPCRVEQVLITVSNSGLAVLDRGTAMR
jgi:hypothetical protein